MQPEIKNTTIETKKDPMGFILLMVLAMAAWGGSWPSAKVIAGMAEAEVLVFWRFSITFISFIPIIIWSKDNLRVNLKTLALIFLSAVLMVIYNELFFAGLRNGLAGVGGVLVTTLSPMFTFILSAFFLGRPVGRREIFGLLLGLIGGFIILDLGNFQGKELVQSGNLLFLLGALVWAALTVTSQKAQGKGVSTFVYSFYLYGFASLFDFFIALRFQVFDALQLAPLFWWNIFYLAIFATTFATSIYFLGSKKLGADRASVFMYLVPVFAVFVSWLLLNEIPKVSTVVGGMLAMGAVYLVNKKNRDELNDRHEA